MARVLPDIITVFITFLIILCSFGVGVFYFVIPQSIESSNTSTYTDVFPSTSHSEMVYRNQTEWPSKFGKVLESMAWAALNPGPSDDAEISGRTIEILFVSYQILVVIILINLLIVMMNATVQRLQDKKHLYWKFARTSIWLEFMKDGIVLPPPFIILSASITFIIRLLEYITYGVWWMNQKLLRGEATTKDMPDSPTPKNTCKLDPIESKRRNEHANLMKTLIDGLINKEKINEDLKNQSTVGRIDENKSEDGKARRIQLSSFKNVDTIA